jgi:pyruvate kinase
MVFNKTKIIATVGPASNTKEKLMELVVAGVDVFRLNFSHGTHEEHQRVIHMIREINERFNMSISILQDLQGPKIRLRDVENGGFEVKRGESLVIAFEEGMGTRERLTSTYDLAKDMKPGEQLLIDDGNIELKVTKVEGRVVYADVVYGGMIKPRKGINMPDTKVSAPSLTAKDREDLIFGLQNEVDWVALSFVRTEVDIMELKKIIQDAGKPTMIVAKIETPMALKNIDKIIDATDAIMVARGDLGVEIPMEEVPLVQKMIVQKCNRNAKPVIIATQMMESMIKNPRPTRAESTDVANAVMDGADALMLSAETASGVFPLETIQSMVKIITHVEKYRKDIYHKYYEIDPEHQDVNSSALVAHACLLAKEISAKGVVAMTKTGYTAFQLASHRPEANIYVFARKKHILTMLNLVWGVRGFVYERQGSTEETFTDIHKILGDTNSLSKGDLYVSTRSVPSETGTSILKLDKI